MNKFGIDIGSTRSDDLDKALQEEVRAFVDNRQNSQRPSVLNIGSGLPFQSLLLTDLGADIVALDIEDFSSVYSPTSVDFVHSDVLSFLIGNPERKFSFVSAQRMLHYLKYSEALFFLTKLRTMNEGKLFISVTGSESAIGNAYPAKGMPITKRFSELEENTQETFSIYEPVCLYSQKEFTELLINAGWEIEKVWTSAFGNHKAICK